MPELIKPRLQKLKKAAQNPRLAMYHVQSESESAIYNWFEKVRKINFTRKHGSGVDVMSKDWDNLIILDACRYDIFRQHHDFSGCLDNITSCASKTPEFVDKTFLGREFHDTIYITANPHAEDLTQDTFFKILKIYDQNKIDDALSDSHNVARPGSTHHQVCTAAVDANKRFPNKRLIIHFMPPHFPALGEGADSIRHKVKKEHDITFRQINRIRGCEYTNTEGQSLANLEQAAVEGYISFEDVKTCYIENLKLVLQQVQQLSEEINGKSIITSDHGELLGKKTVYTPQKTRTGHHREVYVPELRIVPWFTLDYNERRDINIGDPIVDDRVETEKVTSRLKSLGYT